MRERRIQTHNRVPSRCFRQQPPVVVVGVEEELVLLLLLVVVVVVRVTITQVLQGCRGIIPAWVAGARGERGSSAGGQFGG